MSFITRPLAHRLVVAAAALSLPALLAAQEEPPLIDSQPWRILLEQQLHAEKACDLLEVLLFDEFVREGETILEGKISCADGRSFDFVRPHTHQKFELDLCEPAVC